MSAIATNLSVSQPISKHHYLKCQSNGDAVKCTCRIILPTSGLLCAHSLQSIVDNRYFVVRHEVSEINNVFMVFRSYGDFATYRDATEPTLRCFHEIIFGNQPQRLKFDIDGAIYGANTSATSIKIHCIRKAISDTFMRLYAPILTEQRNISPAICECITKSSGAYVNRHLVIHNYYMRDAASVAQYYGVFKARLTELSPEAVKLIDWGVNKSTQNWRIVGSCKLNKPEQIKHLYDPHADQRTSLISPLHSAPGSTMLLPAIYTPPPRPSIGTGGGTADAPDEFVNVSSAAASANQQRCAAQGVASVDVPAALIQQLNQLLTAEERAANRYLDATQLRGGAGNLVCVNYSRLRPSSCSLCGRTHDKDNTVYFIITLDGTYIKKKCRHATSERGDQLATLRISS